MHTHKLIRNIITVHTIIKDTIWCVAVGTVSNDYDILLCVLLSLLINSSHSAVSRTAAELLSFLNKHNWPCHFCREWLSLCLAPGIKHRGLCASVLAVFFQSSNSVWKLGAESCQQWWKEMATFSVVMKSVRAGLGAGLGLKLVNRDG